MNWHNIGAIAIVVLILLGIRLLSSPRTAVAGNRLGAVAMLSAIVMVLVQHNIGDLKGVIVAILIGSVIGAILAVRVTMVKIPQLVALLNGFGGLASLLVAFVVIQHIHNYTTIVQNIAAQLAIAVGGLTFSGSMVAAAKLDKKMSHLPISFKGQSLVSFMLLTAMIAAGIMSGWVMPSSAVLLASTMVILSNVFGFVFAVRIGGADMPVTISLLNSLSGVAASICGFAVRDVLLIAVGAIVGAAGLILTRIMCKAMNRSLVDILLGKTSVIAANENIEKKDYEAKRELSVQRKDVFLQIAELLSNAKRVIIVPGYGMAVSQAQQQVKELFTELERRGVDVKFAIHPVAGRMPGHMNVLLAEVDVPYEKLCELDQVNPEFSHTDVAIVIGACDVVNPMAITAEGTPIYGMPILHVHEARSVIVCNLDEKPGYSGVENPLYRHENVIMVLGNASETLAKILEAISSR
ncbi:MAG: NAD(P)(+) transhydrogenase (Re/Si-specific) subunit beta [Spirochaetes bacterium]|nr:NAD(P)(+) transhydrogenase (Re/Si-specific) subunit beta [Spirochaetota bacterium]